MLDTEIAAPTEQPAPVTGPVEVATPHEIVLVLKRVPYANGIEAASAGDELQRAHVLVKKLQMEFNISARVEMRP